MDSIQEELIVAVLVLTAAVLISNGICIGTIFHAWSDFFCSALTNTSMLWYRYEVFGLKCIQRLFLFQSKEVKFKKNYLYFM